MKTKNLIILLLTSVVIFSCKKEVEAPKEEEKVEAKQNFSVQVDAIAAKSDDFALYYTEDGTVDFKGENAVWRGINGGTAVQQVDFQLTEEKIPTDIRLDFGLKQDQDSVVIRKVKVTYYGNSYEFVGSDFFKYFIEDKQFNTKLNAADGTFTVYKKDGVYKTPYYYPTQLTIDNIKKITKETK